jgi:hypothetical protein
MGNGSLLSTAEMEKAEKISIEDILVQKSITYVLILDF